MNRHLAATSNTHGKRWILACKLFAIACIALFSSMYSAKARADDADGLKFYAASFCQHLGTFSTAAEGIEACRQYRQAYMEASGHWLPGYCMGSVMTVYAYNPSGNQVTMKPNPFCSFGGASFLFVDANCTAADRAHGMPCAPTPHNLGAKHCHVLDGNPVNLATGNKYQREEDYRGSGAFPLVFERHYNSHGTVNVNIGHRWTHTYSRAVVASSPYVISPKSAELRREDGEVLRYQLLGSTWTTARDVAGQLIEVTNPSGVRTGWKFVDEDDTTEEFDANGKLISITDRAGVTQALTYDGSGRLVTVTHSFGHSLSFTYDASGRIDELTTPDGGTTSFTYDTSGNFSLVTYPDTAVREYLYDEPGNVASGSITSLLTGIIDENGQRFASFAYNAASRAIVSQHAGGADRIDITYNANGSTSVLDAAGTTRTRTFGKVDGLFKHSSMTGGLCTRCMLPASQTYDSKGDLASTTDFRGVVTKYVYDARHLQTSRTEAFGTPRARTISTTWHSSIRVPTLISESGRTLSLTQDSSGNVLTRTETDAATSETRVWTFTYSGLGQVLTEDGPRTDASDVTTFTYYSCTTGYQCGQLHTIQNAAGHITTFDSYDAHGQPTQITDANGTVTTLAYDLHQRLTTQCVNGSLPSCTGGELTSIEYWPTGLLKKVTLPGGEFTSYVYDGAHRLTQMTDSAGNSVTYTLDAMGNRTAEDVRDSLGTLRQTHSRVYNALNRLYQDVNAASTGGATTTYAYDNNGNLTSSSAPLGRNASNLYDELNRLKQITDAASGLTYFAYDAQDNLIGVTDPKGTATGYAYNGFSDLLATVSPDTGTTTNTYDSAGNLKTSTDARGAVASYDYDALNRVTSAQYSTGGVVDQTLAFGYDQGGGHNGLLTSAQDANHAMSWDYDAHGRVTGVGQTVGAVTRSVGYGYANGRLAATVLPSGNTLTYGYDAAGRIASITLGSTVILSNVTYEPFGAVKGWDWGNATTHSRSDDEDGRVTAITASHANAVNHSFGYDPASRLTSLTDSGTNPISWGYGYDLLDRLTSATGPASYGWSYDANGNRTAQSSTQPSTFSVSAGSNRLLSTSGSLARTYAYDAAGNVLDDTDRTLTYNSRNRLVGAQQGATSRSYVYNALGQLIRASGSGGTILYVYDEAGHLLGEYDGAGALIQETIWLGDTPVATIRPGSGGGVDYFYVHADHLNTPRKITRPTDNVAVWRWDANPFGQGAANEDPDGNSLTLAYNLRFPGQIFDPVTGLHYNYFRDYDPATGRYVESDPIGLSGGSNTYTYALSNPASLIDPFGLQTIAKCLNPANVAACAAAGEISDAMATAVTAAARKNAKRAAALLLGYAAGREICKDNEADCTREIEACSEMCAEAQSDPNRRRVYGGSMTQCMKNCLPERCGGEPKWKGYR